MLNNSIVINALWPKCHTEKPQSPNSRDSALPAALEYWRKVSHRLTGQQPLEVWQARTDSVGRVRDVPKGQPRAAKAAFQIVDN
jgi:hypothetical protein